MKLGGRYELRQPIAAGGMAQVWSASDTETDELVAVKILHPHLATDDAFVERFRREARAAASLTHRSIVTIYGTISENGLEAIVMELIEGLTLRSVLDEVGAMPAVDVVHFAAEIAAALDEAHRAGIVHRDIKPANIMISPDKRVMVTDFGIAKAGTDADLTQTGTLLGTAKYLAPEQVSGAPIDPRSDLYALGVVMFEALTGTVPFKANTDAATALARLHQDPPQIRSLRPNVSSELAAIVMRLMDRDPNRRYTRASALEDALRAIRSATGDPNDPIRSDFADEARPVPPLPPGAADPSPTLVPAAPVRRGPVPDPARPRPPDPPSATGGLPPTSQTPAVAPAARRWSENGAGPSTSAPTSGRQAAASWPPPAHVSQNGAGAAAPSPAQHSPVQHSPAQHRPGQHSPGQHGPAQHANANFGAAPPAVVQRRAAGPKPPSTLDQGIPYGDFEVLGVDQANDGQALPSGRVVRSARSRILPVSVILAAIVAVAWAGVLLTDVEDRMGIGEDSNPLDESGSGLAIAVVNSFDPETLDEDKAEREELTPLAFDGDLTTAWLTENYRRRSLGGLKSGVGLLIRLEDAVPLNRIELDSNSEGWVAEIYVGSEFAADGTGWGDPVALVEAGSNRVVRDLGRVKGDVVLLWIRDTGVTDERFRFELAEVVIR
jgi:serine/threonine-protein kinase